MMCVLLALGVAGAAKTKVTCIGDSITEGAGCANYISYVSNLQTLLGEQFEVVNAGASSQTQLKNGLCFAPPATDKCSYRDTDAWQRALTSGADIYTIQLGTNDAKSFNWQGVQMDTGDFYTLDYLDMVQELARLSPPPKAIFVMVPPPLWTNSTGSYPFHMDPRIINSVLPQLIPEIARIAGPSTVTGVIDVQGAVLSSPFAKPNSKMHSKLTCDGCHPTPLTNQIIANAMAPHILAVAKD